MLQFLLAVVLMTAPATTPIPSTSEAVIDVAKTFQRLEAVTENPTVLNDYSRAVKTIILDCEAALAECHVDGTHDHDLDTQFQEWKQEYIEVFLDLNTYQEHEALADQEKSVIAMFRWFDIEFMECEEIGSDPDPDFILSPGTDSQGFDRRSVSYG